MLLAKHNIEKITKMTGKIFYLIGLITAAVGAATLLLALFRVTDGCVHFEDLAMWWLLSGYSIPSGIFFMIQGLILYSKGQIIENTSNLSQINSTSVSHIETSLKSDTEVE